MSMSRPSSVSLAVVLLATGCATGPGAPSTPAGTAAGTAAGRPVSAGADVEAFYRLGRYLQGQQRDELALAAYAQALAADPRHAATLNAVGVLRSQRGETELAERALRAALEADPQEASTHNNLGFHLLRAGRAAEALAQLEQARALAPLDGVVLGNLAQARVAAQLQEAAAQALAAAAAGPAAAQAPHPSMQPTVQVARVGEGVWELKNAPTPPVADRAEPAPAPVVAAAPSAAPAAPAAAPSKREDDAVAATAAGPVASLPRIEVSNGHGGTGLARRTLAALQLPVGTPTRLTNHKPFGKAMSRIEYVPGAEQAARDIGARIPAVLPATPVAHLERGVGVRVLLGKDFSPQPQNLAAASH